VLFWLPAEVRARWRGWLVLTVVFGITAGGALAIAAGARRTETVYDRLLAGTRAFDVLFTNGGTTPTNVNTQFDFAEIARLPMVTEAARASYYAPTGRTASGRAISANDILPLAPADNVFGRTLNRSHVVEGRPPTSNREIAVSVSAQQLLGVGVGDTVQLALTGPAGLSVTPRPMPMTVVGVVAVQGGIPPRTGGLPTFVLLGREYARTHPDANEVIAVRLAKGERDATAFGRTLERLAGGEQVVTANARELGSVVQRGLDLQAAALRLLAAAVAVAAVLLLTQGLVRQRASSAGDDAILRSLGISPRQLRAAGVLGGIAIGVIAAVVAIVTAVTLSPLAPVGDARKAELHPGVSINAGYLGVGAVAIVVIAGVLGAVTSWRWARTTWADHEEADATDPPRLAPGLTGSALPVAATVGVRMAVQPGRGRTVVPMRATLMGASVGVATVVALITFASSLGHLFDEPRLYGWNWDVQIGDQFAPDLSGTASELRRRPDVTAAVVGTVSRLGIDDVEVDALAIDASGDIEPVVIEGRPADTSKEILLGSRTLRDLGKHVGDRVIVSLGDRSASMRIVGRAVLPTFAGEAGLGEGAVLTLDGAARVIPDVVSDTVLIRLRPGTDARRFLAEPGVVAPQVNPYLPGTPSDLADLERVGGMPSLVAALLGLMAAAAVAHTLITSVRRHRRDLAILKVLGFGRRQVSAVVAWQATVIALVATVVGLPVGMVVGRWLWRLFADRLGVPPEPVTPLVAVIVVAPAAVLLANAVAAVPAWWAGRTQPAAVLRTG
jgi:ABC-type lipoprotein release transport system permease subunit